ncbi:MAG: redoxin family protein [Xanthomarina sp.]
MVFLIVNKAIKSIFDKNLSPMKLYVLVLSMAFNLFSCSDYEKNQSPDKILEKAFKQLNNWETISFTAETTNSDKTKASTSTVYKLKRVNYEPHLKLFFSKEMNKDITIYYKLASLVVVEDKKMKITNFDYNQDTSIPKYLVAYMGDDDNLLVTSKLMNQFKDDMVYVEQVLFNNEQAYVYTFKNYKLWLDIKKATPLKFEITNGTSVKKEIVYKALVFNEVMNDDVFSPKDKEGYVSTVYGVKKEPMLNVKAPDWSLMDLDGKKVSLNTFLGTPVFIEAWVSSCGHCMESVPKVKQIEKQFGDKLKVVTVSFDYDLNETKETVKNEGINYLVLQGDAIFDQNYDLRSFPSYFVIDSEGIIIYSGRGTIETKKEKALFEALKNVK